MHIRLRCSLLLLLVVLLPVQATRKAKQALPVGTTNRILLSENDRWMFDYFFNEALNARQQGSYDAAFDCFNHCLLIDSTSAQTWFELSSFYNNLKLDDWGLMALEKANSLDPSNDWYAMGLANQYLGMKQFDKAIVLYEKLVTSRPEDENLHYYLATLYGRLKDAIREYTMLENLVGKNEQITGEKFKLYQAIGKPQKAIREVQELVKATPYNADVLLFLGDSWMALNKPKEALKSYEAARLMDPKDPAVALTYADYYNQMGDSIEARKQFLIALTNPETDVETKLEIFTPILAQWEGTADSIRIPELFSTLLEQHPNEYQVWELHVQYLLLKGRKDEAKKELRTVLDLHPDQLQTWKDLLQITADANNQQEIKKLCMDALVFFPGESVFWFYLGLSQYPDVEKKPATDDFKEAMACFQKAISVSKPDDAQFLSRVYGLIGDSYMSMENRAQAYEYYEKALAVHPGNILVLNNYAYNLSEEDKELAKAEKMSRITIDAEPKNATYLDTYAWIFFKEGKYALAKIYMERAIANEPDPSAVILEHYGDILWFNDEKAAAVEQWKKALQLPEPSTEVVEKAEKGTYIKPKNKQP